MPPSRPAVLLASALAIACGGSTPPRARGVGIAGGGPVSPDIMVAPPVTTGDLPLGPPVVTHGGPPFAFAGSQLLPDPSGQYNIAPGFALLDLDGDGDLDLIWPQGEASPLAYRNDGGMRFTPVDVGLPQAFPATAAALTDCDGDGDLDVLLTGIRRSALLRREGSSFAVVDDPGVDVTWAPGAVLFFDADGDGRQDLYVPSYLGTERDRLYLGTGDCRFRDASAQVEPRPPGPPGGAHGVSALDVEGDGDTDLLVFNDFAFLAGPDRLLVNDGGGGFTDQASAYGLADTAFSMSAEWADLDGDGRFDVYKGNTCRNPFARGGEPGQPFVPADRELGISAAWIEDPDSPPLEIPQAKPGEPLWLFLSEYAGDRPDSPYARCLTSWSTPTADLDADGWRELLVVNGAVGIDMESSREPAQLYWRAPGASAFAEVGEKVGLRHGGRGRTGAFADLDGDGRLDVVLGNIAVGDDLDEPGQIFRNASPADRVGHGLFVELRGPGANTQGIGAVVRVTSGGRTQVAYRTLGTSFLAASAAPLHFGLGAAGGATVEVIWPYGGGVDRFEDVPAGRVTLGYGGGR